MVIKKDTKIATSVADSETILTNIFAGATNLSAEELHHLFQFRNLVF